MTAGTVAVGALLLAPVAFGTVEAVGYLRGRFLRSFWELPLDAKLDHIGRNDSAWWLMMAAWPPLIVVITGGLAGLASVLDDAVAWAAFGAFVVAAVAWLVGIVQQCAALSVAAHQRALTGETPSWAFVESRIGQVFETLWVGVANLAAAGYGGRAAHRRAAAVAGVGGHRGWPGHSGDRARHPRNLSASGAACVHGAGGGPAGDRRLVDHI